MTLDPSEDWVLAAVERYQKPLLRFVAGIVGATLAPDVVQEAFLRLCRQQRSTVEGQLAAWLFTVARNRALELKRRDGREGRLPEEDDVRSPDSGPQSKAERAQAMTRVSQLLEQLPERQREALLLKFAGDLSYKEIAEVMKLSVSNVGFILHTALRTVRSQLAHQLVETGRMP